MEGYYEKDCYIRSGFILVDWWCGCHAAGSSIVGKKVDKAVTLTVDGKDL